MAHTRLPLAMHARTAAFRRLAALLQADVELRRVVRTWDLAAGEPRDETPPALTQMPRIKLWGLPLSSAWTSTRTALCPLLLTIEIHVAGTDPDDLLNLWGAIEAVLLPHHDAARRTALNTTMENLHGIIPLRVDVESPPRPAGEGQRAPWQHMRARLQVDLYLR